MGQCGNDLDGKEQGEFQNVQREELFKQAEIARLWIEEQKEGKEKNGQFLKSLSAIADALAVYGLATPWNDKFGGVVFGQLLKNRETLRIDGATLAYRNKDIHIPPCVAKALALLVDNLVAVEINRALGKNQGATQVARALRPGL